MIFLGFSRSGKQIEGGQTTISTTRTKVLYSFAHIVTRTQSLVRLIYQSCTFLYSINDNEVLWSCNLYLFFFLLLFFYKKISGDSTPLTQTERCPLEHPNLFFESTQFPWSFTPFITSISNWHSTPFKIKFWQLARFPTLHIFPLFSHTIIATVTSFSYL